VKANDTIVRLRKQVLDGHIETLMLAVLESQPDYAYSIVKVLEKRSRGILQLEESTVYAALHRLHRKNLLTARRVTAENGRPRKYYRLTRKGHHALESGRRQWRILSAVMEAVV